MNILVCGGAGYIGSHTVRLLSKLGYNVLVLDNLVTGNISAVEGVRFVKADLNIKSDIETVFKKNKIDAVMHFAAFSIVGESVVKPDIYYRNNVVGTLNLIEIMLSFKVKKLIFSSSAAVYGEPQYLPVCEEHPTNPTNPYGATKLAVEEMLKCFDSAYGLKYISLRYFNAAGADLAADIGEDHNPESHLIPLVLKSALGKLHQIKIYGCNYPTKDGTCIRDYIHVNDISYAHILALKKLFNDNKSVVYNIGNGTGFSVLDVINTAEEIIGNSLNVVKEMPRVGDPVALVASSVKIQKELGWQPHFKELNEIINTAWKWHRLHPNGFKMN